MPGRRHWLESSIVYLVEEAASGRVGSDAMLAKLSEALFVDTLRRHVDSLPEQQTGWLAGTRDLLVGKSLGLLHGRIAHPWTIADLADEVGISRSALVERFTKYLSEPPMAYLTHLRLRVAARSLEKTSRGIADIAADVGYESEAAGARIASFFWIQSMIRGDAERTLLFDLDVAIQRLAGEYPDHPSAVQLTGVYHNLLRRWATV